jgi:hypothetical protein
MRTLMLTTLLALALICWGGEKVETNYEVGMITEVSNAGRPMDHWFIMQTECCFYTIQNWRLFSGFSLGGLNDVWIRDDHAFIRVGTKVGKARILNARQREGYDPALSVVADPQGALHRTGDIASLPEGWLIVVRDATDKVKTLPKNSTLPAGCHIVRGFAWEKSQDLAFPPVLTGER